MFIAKLDCEHINLRHHGGHTHTHQNEWPPAVLSSRDGAPCGGAQVWVSRVLWPSPPRSWSTLRFAASTLATTGSRRVRPPWTSGSAKHGSHGARVWRAFLAGRWHPRPGPGLLGQQRAHVHQLERQQDWVAWRHVRKRHATACAQPVHARWPPSLPPPLASVLRRSLCHHLQENSALAELSLKGNALTDRSACVPAAPRRETRAFSVGLLR